MKYKEGLDCQAYRKCCKKQTPRQHTSTYCNWP